MMMMMQSNARDEALSVAFGGEKEICFDSIPPSLLFDTLLYGRCRTFFGTARNDHQPCQDSCSAGVFATFIPWHGIEQESATCAFRFPLFSV